MAIPYSAVAGSSAARARRSDATHDRSIPLSAPVAAPSAVACACNTTKLAAGLVARDHANGAVWRFILPWKRES
ncbi:MAG TPA: hypothetical protein VF006_30260 [Longimicrobium sp.]